MTKKEILDAIHGKMIISCQAVEGEPLYVEEKSIMYLMARAAKQAGTPAIRTSSIRDVVAIKEETGLPVIGLVKIILSAKSGINVARHGVETRAYDVSYKLSETVNDVKYYRLYASYTNQRGEYTEGKTQKLYTIEQAEELVKNKNPLIKYYGEVFEIVPEKEGD